MIGVRPESQGQGYARQLLEEVRRRSERHPCSTGVALDTENAENVAIYERLGYQVVARDRLGGLTV
jgi:ribosomal protein S18 acetylase RimI-like enzyme